MAKGKKKAGTGQTPKLQPPKKLSKLKASPWNPRTIDPDAAKGLAKSLDEFGDISGIVVHKEGYLIAGHQRVEAIRAKYGTDLPIVGGAITAPDGKRFPVRVVDWDKDKSKAANLAANNPLIGGKFTSEGATVVDAVALSRPDLADELRLQEMVYELPEDGDVGPGEGADALIDRLGPPAMELQPFEHYDYLVVLASNVNDFAWLCDRLGIKRVDASPVPAKKKIGLGRAIPAARLIAALGGSGGTDGKR